MKKRTAIITGAATGAGAAYLLDPERGRRRRAQMRDKAVHATTVTGGAADATKRDLSNRIRGALSEARSIAMPGDRPDDVVLAERVRERLGYTVTHPSALTVEVHDGIARLSGDVLAREVPRLRFAVNRVRGIRGIEEAFRAHERADGVSALQGAGRIPRSGARKEHWSPSARAAALGAGSIVAIRGMRRGGIRGTAMTGIGALAAARAVLDRPVERIVGVGAGRRAVEVQKTITVEAPIEQVWETWRSLERLPEFMTHVREVRAAGDGDTYHWTVDGPAGTSVEFDARITDEDPGRLLAWRTEPGSTVQHAGSVRFTSVDGGTEIDVKLAYNPVAGAIGDAVASVFGRDAKSQIDDDLMRFKSMIETGRRPRDAAAKAP